MKEQHITEVLARASLTDLSQSELSDISVHVRDCISCRTAYEAAQLSALILKERAKLTTEPSPFFETRVLAAWRERQAEDDAPALRRLWESARALVSSMAVTTAALGVLSFMIPASSNAGFEETASSYSAEAVILDQGSDEPMTYEQVLSTIYSEEDEAK